MNMQNRPMMMAPPMGMNPAMNPAMNQSMSTIYVGDLEEEVDEGMLFQFFCNQGNIYSVKIMRDSVNRKSRGFGYVTYYSAESSKKAIAECNHQKIIKNPIRVCIKKNKNELDRSCNLFVKDLDKKITVQQLDSCFQKFGTIVSCKVALDEDMNSRGYGYVQFESVESSKKCLEAHEETPFEIEGCKISLQNFKLKTDRPDSRTNLYIKNLPQETNEEVEKKIKSLFGEDNISSIIVRLDNKINRFFAFCCFKLKDQAEEAFNKFNGSTAFSEEEPLYINWAEKKAERIRKLRQQYKSVKNETNIFTKFVKESVTEEQLKEFFSKFGEIASLVLKTPAENKSRDQTHALTKLAFIDYKDKEAAKKAILESHQNNEEFKQFYEEERVYVTFLIKKDQLNQMKTAIKRNYRMKNPMDMMNKQMPRGGRPAGGQPKRKFGPMPGAMGAQGMMPGMPPMMPQMMQGMPAFPGMMGMPGMPQMMPGMPGMPGVKLPEMPLNQTGDAQQKQDIFSKKVTAEELKQNLPQFLELAKERQRTIFGEILFPLVKKHTDAKQAPKITGMLIDFEVFEVQDIVGFIESEEQLKERITEAIELIEDNGEDN